MSHPRESFLPAPISLSLFWFFYFAGIGIYFPYFSLYLRENAGLSATETGIVLSTWPVVGIFMQPLWGQIADRTGARVRVLGVLTLGAAAGFLLVGQSRGFVAIALASLFVALFATAVIPMLFSISLGALRDAGPHAFGRSRVWATVSFLLLVVGFPRLLHVYQDWRGLERATKVLSEPGLEIMFPAIAALVFLAALSTFAFPRTEALRLRAARGEVRPLFRHSPLRRLLLFVFLAYTFTQGPMMQFPVYIRSIGGTIDTVGALWIPMLLLEIPIVVFSGTGLTRFGLRNVLALGMIAAGVRWLTCGLTGNAWLVYPIQLLHGIIVAGLMLGGPIYLEAIVPERLRSTGQTLLAMIGIGLGGMASHMLTGFLMETFGTRAPYLAGGAGALLLGVGAWWWLPHPYRLEVDPDIAS